MVKKEKVSGIKAAEFFDLVSQKTRSTDIVTAKDIKAVFEAVEEVIADQLAKVGEIKVPNIGKAVLKVKPAGDYQVPFAAPGTMKHQPEKKKLRFKLTKTIREQFERK